MEEIVLEGRGEMVKLDLDRINRFEVARMMKLISFRCLSDPASPDREKTPNREQIFFTDPLFLLVAVRVQ